MKVLILSFLCELALSNIITLFLVSSVIIFFRNLTNLLESIPLFSYNFHAITPLLDIAKIPVYFLNTSC